MGKKKKKEVLDYLTISKWDRLKTFVLLCIYREFSRKLATFSRIVSVLLWFEIEGKFTLAVCVQLLD